MRKHNPKQPTVLFDLGNVIVNIHFDRSYKIWAEKTGLSLEHLKKSFYVDEAYKKHEVNAITRHQYHEHVCNTYGVNLSFEDFTEGWMALFGEPIRETVALIEEIKDHANLYVFSNSNVQHREKWSVLYADILKNFNKVYCSSAIQHRKPNPEGFQLIMKEHGIKPSEMIFTDDMLENIQGAEKLGIRGVHFTEPKVAVAQLRKELAKHKF